MGCDWGVAWWWLLFVDDAVEPDHQFVPFVDDVVVGVRGGFGVVPEDRFDVAAEAGGIVQVGVDDVGIQVVFSVEEQFDGKVELIFVDVCGAILHLFGETDEGIDVVVGGADVELTAAGAEGYLVPAGEFVHAVVGFFSEEAQHAALAGEAEDVFIVAEEERFVVDVAAEAKPGAAGEDDLDGVDTDAGPEGVFVGVGFPFVGVE